MTVTNKPVWRPMTPADLPDVMAIAAVVHPDYPEDLAVFDERLRLSPKGCLVLEIEGEPAGYIVSHRWLPGALPALNSLLGAIPDGASDWYIHDIALLPRARGSGAAGKIVAQLLEVARQAGCGRLALVAVNNSTGFWEHQGFGVVEDAALAPKLASYDDAARYMVRRLNS
jgi:ribosomal protein S18 acetylase RimI-like enzyme